MTDIGIELYEAISEDFDKSVESDTVINDIRKRMDNGTASSKDIALYANRLGLWIRTAIERNVSADKLPNGQMYYNIAEKILRPSLQTTNQMFNAVAAEIQKVLDSKQGIRIKPQTVSLPEERIDDVIGAASEPGITEEVMQRRMSVPAETITRSYADDYARANADFRSRAGIDEYIVRRDDGSCCEWCSHLAGRYRYPDEVPKDVYRRHDNCGCIVEHQSGGMRKNVHTKRSGTDEQQREALRELDERKQQQREKIRQAAENAQKPRVLSKAEGSRIEAEVLAKRRERLTGEAESGIIKSITISDFIESDSKGTIGDDCKKAIIDTLKTQNAVYKYDEIKIVSIPADENNRIEPLRTNAVSTPKYAKVVLEVNEEALGGKSKDKIDKWFKMQDYSTINSLEEAVIHESAHAKIIDGLTYEQYEELDKLLSGSFFTKAEEGKKSLQELAGEISKYAQKDGLECIAECHVKLSRGESISERLKELHDKYIK